MKNTTKKFYEVQFNYKENSFCRCSAKNKKEALKKMQEFYKNEVITKIIEL